MNAKSKPSVRRVPSVRRAAALVAAAALLSLGGACNSLTLRREPETARIKIGSPDVETVTLVTAKRFAYERDPGCAECPAVVRPVNSDTLMVSVPFDRTYALDSRLQFFAETYATGTEPVTLSMTAYVDDTEWSRSTRVLRPGSENGEPETIQFVYEYSRTNP